MLLNLGLIAALGFAGLGFMFWLYRKGKTAVLLEFLRDELKKISRIRIEAKKIDDQTKKQIINSHHDRLAPRSFWMRRD